MSHQGLGRGLDALLSRKKIEAPQPIPIASIPGESEIVVELPVEHIGTNEFQPRSHFDEEKLKELADSIKEYGIIQPLIVTKSDDGYRLIAGERRLRAAKSIGLTRVPVVVRDSTHHERLALAIIENVQRVDLNPMELAVGYRQLRDEFNLTQDEIARRVGKSRPTVTNFLRMLNAHPYVQDGVRNGLIGDGQAKVLMSLDLEKQQVAAEKLVTNKWTVYQLQTYLKSINHVPKIIREKNEFVTTKEDVLRNALGTRVAINRKNGRGRILIEYYSDEQLIDIVNKIADAF